MKKNFTSTLAGASIFIAAAGFLSRGLGFIREIIFANHFGTENIFDVYLAGSIFAVIINTSLFYLSQNYIIPNYHRKKENDKNKFLTNSFYLFLILGFGISLLLFLLSDFIVSKYIWFAEKQNQILALNIFKIFLITIPVNSLIAFYSSYLQAKEKIKETFSAPLFLNISIIFSVIILNKFIGIYSIPAGYLIGSLLQLFFVFVKSEFKPNLGLPKINFDSSILLIILIEIISQLYTFVDRYFINYVEAGVISALNYALTIFLLPVSTFGFAIANASFAKCSNLISDEKFSELNNNYEKVLKWMILIFVPTGFIYFFFGEIIIEILFERGNFNANSKALTFEALKMLSISLLFYGTYSVINKLLFVFRLTKQLLVLTALTIILKIILNYILTPIFARQSLALSTSISFIFISVCGSFLISKRIKINYLLAIKLSVSVFLFCFLSIIISKNISSLIFENNYLKDIFSILFFSIFCFAGFLFIKKRI